MSKKTISHDKHIKKIIEEEHDGLFYEKTEIGNIVNNIFVELKKEYKIDNNTLIDSIIYFVYFSEKKDKYYFNHKKRQISKKDYHDTIITEINQDPTSDDLELLEKEIFSKKELDSENSENSENNDDISYNYPKEIVIKPNKKYYFEPHGTQWVHDIQTDDKITSREIKLSKQFDILRAIKLPEQRSAEWFEMRDGKITASDGGTVIDVNPHEQQYKFILKKTVGVPFISNEFVYHGKKLEEIAILVYEYRMNVKCEAFGLIGHPNYKFLGASPDSICGKYKLNGINKSKYIGRMLEIKCPFVRKIKMDGPIIDHICPIYYWVQVQLQLECCDLEECDFWQCEIREYESREEFIKDTHSTEPFRSKENNYEKGCLIQLLPKSKMQDILDGKYNTVVWDDAKFIYPPKIEMTPYDCDIWISEKMNELKTNDEYTDYFLDKIIYWKVVVTKCVVINRDKKWFADNLPIFEKMWNYVLFFRKNKDMQDLMVKYIDSLSVKKNKLIMNTIEKICNTSDPNYKNIIKDINNEINKNKSKKNTKTWNSDDDEYMFQNPEDQEEKAIPSKNKKVTVKNQIDDDYMFAPISSPNNKQITANSKKTSSKPLFKKTAATATDDDDGYSFI